eukprot:m.333475 g.333475  ORF g.333475 m.333475 type:complete len:238 (+) comp55650_c1_seq2:807-1520(+)
MIAAEWRMTSNCLQRLLDSGADPSLRDRMDQTALHRAADVCSQLELEILLKACSIGDINAQDQAGNTPLLTTLNTAEHKFQESKVLAVVQMLLNHGASTEIKNRKGATAKTQAEARNLITVLQLFEAHEKYLANLGARTKPALRVAPVALSVATEQLPASVNLLDAEVAHEDAHLSEMEMSEATSVQGATTTSFAACHASGSPETAESTAHVGHPVPAFHLDLSDLCADLDAIAASE